MNTDTNKEVKIFITGATGRLANYAIDYLQELVPEAKLFGLVRSRKTEGAKKLEKRGVVLREGDYSNKESLVQAFEGMDRLLFISFPNSEMSANIVSAAKEAKINYIAYTSVNGIEYSKNGLEINHRQTEELIRQTGIEHTFLRNSWYLEMEIGPFKAAIETGNYYYLSEGVISYATRKEFAEAAARVVATMNFPEVVELGRKASSHIEIGKTLEKVIGKKLNIEEVDIETYTANLEPYKESGFEVNMQQYVAVGNNGEDKVNPTDFETVLGRPMVSLEEAIKSVINLNSEEFRRTTDKDFKGYK